MGASKVRPTRRELGRSSPGGPNACGPSTRRTAAAIALVAAAAACGGAEMPDRSSAPPPARAGPDTEGDPTFYTPSPIDGTASRGDEAVSVSGAQRLARQIAVRLVLALAGADGETLQELFAKVLYRAGKQRNKSAHLAIERCLKHAAQLGWRAQLPVGELVELKTIAARRVADLPEEESLPPGLRPSDLAVDLRPPASGKREGFPCFRNASGSTRIYLRPGPHPRIVSF